MSTFPTPDEHQRAGEGLDAPSAEITLTGHDVLDDHHQKLGTVSDVLYDDTGDARWAVVDPGPLRAEKYVPIQGSYVTADGAVVVPYGKDQVKAAAKVNRDHVLDQDVEQQLVRHYELDRTDR